MNVNDLKIIFVDVLIKQALPLTLQLTFASLLYSIIIGFTLGVV